MNAIAPNQKVIEMLPVAEKPIADPMFEAAFLGSILLDPVWACQYTHIPPEAFYTYEHQAVWKVILSIVAAGQQPDMTRTSVTCHDQGMKDPRKLIGSLVDGVSSSCNHDLYAEKILDLYKRRRLDDFTHQIKSAVRSKNTDWAIKLQSQCHELFTEVGTGDGLLHISSKFDESIQRQEFYRTGLAPLDRLAGSGFSPGKLISVAGRPAMGKSAFVCWLAGALCNTFVSDGTNKGVAFFSLEMSHDDVIHRVISPIVGIPFNEIRERGAGGDPTIAAAKQVIPNIPIWVSDSPSLTWESIVAQCVSMAASGNLGAVIIDHLHHLIPDSGPEGVAMANKAVPAFANMAKLLGVPVILVCQLNRGVEGRADKIPVPSDIREFYVVEQQSAMMLMLYRDEYYNPETEKRGVTLIRCAKNRYGPTGDVEVLGNLAYSTYLEMSYATDRF